MPMPAQGRGGAVSALNHRGGAQGYFQALVHRGDTSLFYVFHRGLHYAAMLTHKMGCRMSLDLTTYRLCGSWDDPLRRIPFFVNGS